MDEWKVGSSVTQSSAVGKRQLRAPGDRRAALSRGSIASEQMASFTLSAFACPTVRATPRERACGRASASAGAAVVLLDPASDCAAAAGTELRFRQRKRQRAPVTGCATAPGFAGCPCTRYGGRGETAGGHGCLAQGTTTLGLPASVTRNVLPCAASPAPPAPPRLLQPHARRAAGRRCPGAVPAGWAVAGADASPPLQQISELRALSDTVIVLEIEMLKKDLLLLNVKKATKQDVKCHQFVVLRKKVAMLKTIRRERELEQGIKKRESRRIDKSKRMISTFW